MNHCLPLTLNGVESALSTRWLGRRIELRDQIDSTNSEAVALGQAGVEHGTLVLAESQTAGRGRLGRQWFSPHGINLYASIVIRASVNAQRLSQWLSWLPLLTALSTAEAIEALAGSNVSVKWPNDLLMSNRKVGGILCESGTSTGLGPFQVIGIGINVNGTRADFPEEFRETATSIRHEIGRQTDRTRLLVRILQELEACLEEFLVQGTERIAMAYRHRCSTLGKTVKAVLADGDECTGVAQAIDQDGSLTLAQAPLRQGLSAEIRRLRAADITHLR